MDARTPAGFSYEILNVNALVMAFIFSLRRNSANPYHAAV
jgi:hypothetical protein